MLPFTGPLSSNENFIAYNDHLVDKRINFDTFYSEGAHEKGIIAWNAESTTDWKGFLIDHSLPLWPMW